MMSMIWTADGPYRHADYDSEADLENAIVQVQAELFGPNRLYLPVKKKIAHNIPDGYLIDLSGAKPRLYVVENELASHDLLHHIAVQVLKFSLAFESEGRSVKSILFRALQDKPALQKTCEQYAATHNFRNLDHLLEFLVFDSEFAALVIIDELPEDLENVLVRKFQFGVEVIELARYQNEAKQSIYRFEPFLADLSEDLPPAEVAEVDTVVVPARADGVEPVFLGENRWYAIRVHGTMRPQIKHIALYQVAPESAITHIAPVKSIEPWKDSGKFVVNFAAPAVPLGPIPLVKGGRVKALQNLRYTTRERLEAAKTLDDIW